MLLMVQDHIRGKTQNNLHRLMSEYVAHLIWFVNRNSTKRTATDEGWKYWYDHVIFWWSSIVAHHHHFWRSTLYSQEKS